MANKESKEKWTAESVMPVITEAVLSTDGVAGLVQMQPLHQGVLIANLFGNVDIDIFVNVFYGFNIPELSWDIQEKVKSALGQNTSLVPSHINIHIEGVDLSNVRKDEQQSQN